MARTEEILDCLQLINSENVGPVTFYKLLELYHSAAEALQALPKHKKLKPFSRREAELELKRAEDKGIRILLYKDQDYPDNLRQMEDAPPLVCRGQRFAVEQSAGLFHRGSPQCQYQRAQNRIANRL